MGKTRKHYPGDLRQPGTKDYGLILSNLIKYRNELALEKKEEAIVKLYLKIAEKLKELGFKKEGIKVKKWAKQPGKILKKREQAEQITIEKWREGKELHEQVKKENKAKEKEMRRLQRIKNREAKKKETKT